MTVIGRILEIIGYIVTGLTYNCFQDYDFLSGPETDREAAFVQGGAFDPEAIGARMEDEELEDRKKRQELKSRKAAATEPVPTKEHELGAVRKRTAESEEKPVPKKNVQLEHIREYVRDFVPSVGALSSNVRLQKLTGMLNSAKYMKLMRMNPNMADIDELYELLNAAVESEKERIIATSKAKECDAALREKLKSMP